MDMVKTTTKIIPKPKKGPRNDWTMAIGDRLQRLRLSVGLTQEEFAKTIGVKGRNSIAMIESGRNFPTLATLTAIKNKYHVSYDYLLTGDKPAADRENEQEVKRLKDENQKLREYIDLLKTRSKK